MPKLLYNVVTNDAGFGAEIVNGEYPNGFGDFADREPLFDAYESQLLVLPQYNNAAPTTAWVVGSGYGTLPAGLKQRGPYEVYAYGLAAWIANILKPNTAAWVAAKIGAVGSNAALTFSSTILLDYESWAVYSFNYDGAYAYFKSASGLTDNNARRQWEIIVTGLLVAQVQELRALLPNARIVNPYICKQSPLGFSDKYNGAGDFHTGSTIVDTGRKFRDEMIRQLVGKAPLFNQGGNAGWLLPILRLYDYVSSEWYMTIGITTPGGGNITLGSGVSLAAETINTISAYDTAYLIQNNANVLRRVAAEAGKPLLMMLIPYYPGSSPGGNLQITGTNALDAELYIRAMKSAGANVAVWMSGGVPSTEPDKQRCRDGLLNINPLLRKIYGF